MATIKSYTDIPQSKKLSEILPLESADMRYEYSPIERDNIQKPIIGFSISSMNYYKDSDLITYFPCWSLAALLGVLLGYTLQTNTDGTVFVVCESKKPMISDAYDNPIDACYEMIIRLYEEK